MARGRKKGYANPMKGIKRDSDQYWDIQYNTYLNKRQDSISKGTKLNKELDKEEFKNQYSLFKKENIKNVINKMVKVQERVTYQDAISLYENKNNIKFNPFSKAQRDEVNKIYNYVPNEVDMKKAEKNYYDKYGHGFREDKNYSDYIYFATMIEMGYDREELEKDYGY